MHASLLRQLQLNASSKLNLAQHWIGRPKHVTVGQNNK